MYLGRKLSLYPNGKGASQNNYISLYLSIEETATFPAGWEVFANFKLFVYDQVRDNYLTIHGDICINIFLSSLYFSGLLVTYSNIMAFINHKPNSCRSHWYSESFL